jgi:diguanylate cyclase (GGDEF)-like protein
VTESASERWHVTRWAVWSLDGRVLLPVLVVESAALAVVVSSIVNLDVRAGELGLLVFLAMLAVVHTEIAVGIERIRRRSSGASYFDFSSVWTFAAAVLLPPAFAAVVIVLVYLHLWWRVWKPTKVPFFRNVFTTATVVLAAAAARQVVESGGDVDTWLEGMGGVGRMVLAILLYVTVNTALVAAAIALSTSRPKPSDLMGHWDDNMIEIATLCLGALVAIAVMTNPWLVLLVLPPLLVLHRAVLVRQLEEDARTDGKTGLLNAAAWHQGATREFRRAQRGRTATGVLILDLDHFKRVNDAHGHLAGDDVLVAVATAMRGEVRDNDLVGRFGGEEFVVLVPELDHGVAGQSELRAIAERIRHRIAQLRVAVETPDGTLTIGGLTTSIGAAIFPEDGTSLDHVMKTADCALYAAKKAGRNAVHFPEPPEIPVPRAAEPH